MLLILVLLLLIFWAGGFALSIGGGLIHGLLLLALVVLAFHLVQGARSGL